MPQRHANLITDIISQTIIPIHPSPTETVCRVMHGRFPVDFRLSREVIEACFAGALTWTRSTWISGIVVFRGVQYATDESGACFASIVFAGG